MTSLLLLFYLLIMFFYLYINDSYVVTITSNLIPRVGDSIEFDGKEYTVRKVLLETRKYTGGYKVASYTIYVA